MLSCFWNFLHKGTDAVNEFLEDLNLSTGTRIWEPACGQGHMVRAIQAMGYPVIGTDIQMGDDFLTCVPRACDWIITNPPFNLAEQFVRRCDELHRPFALLLKSQFWHAAKRYELFQTIPPAWILPLTWRPDFTGKGQAMMDMSWVVWNGNGNTRYRPLKRPE